MLNIPTSNFSYSLV